MTSPSGEPVVWREPVLDEWIDYNGHLSEPYYVLVLGHATDAVMDAVGLGPEYRAAHAASLFTVEAHVRYLDQVAAGVDLEVAVVGDRGDRQAALDLARAVRRRAGCARPRRSSASTSTPPPGGRRRSRTTSPPGSRSGGWRPRSTRPGRSWCAEIGGRGWVGGQASVARGSRRAGADGSLPAVAGVAVSATASAVVAHCGAATPPFTLPAGSAPPAPARPHRLSCSLAGWGGGRSLDDLPSRLPATRGVACSSGGWGGSVVVDVGGAAVVAQELVAVR